MIENIRWYVPQIEEDGKILGLNPILQAYDGYVWYDIQIVYEIADKEKIGSDSVYPSNNVKYVENDSI